MQPNIVPALDPNPLPAPYWVFKTLLIVTFFLHMLAMNAMLGGAVLAVLGWGRSRTDKYGARLFSDVSRKLPALVPATITLGVAPLLFVQVIYGQYFYTSSILIAWPWLLVLALLTVAYYGFYFAASERASRRGPVLLTSTALIGVIAFVYTNNSTLSQTPAAWAPKYFADPSGWNLNLSEPTLIPRLLHIVFAAVAVGGLVFLVMALRQWTTDEVYARYLLRQGSGAFLYATMAQFAIGTWFLVSLPREQRMMFMGDDRIATVCFASGIAAALALIVATQGVRTSENPRRAAFVGLGGTGLVIILMVVMRDRLRDACLGPLFSPDQFTSKTQWSTLPLFLALFLAGVALWIVMMKRYFQSAGRQS